MVVKGKQGKPTLKKSVGASGTTNFLGTIDTGEYVAKLKGSTLYDTIDKMRWSDASVQAALLMCELPIRRAEWSIEPASENSLDVEVAEKVEDNLFNDLVIPWKDVLRQILLMHPYGCMVFEIIYKSEKDGSIGWRKIAPRLPSTIEKWQIDDNGELEYITQRVYKDGDYKTVDIPIEKLLVFTYRREGDNYKGTSLLRQAYKHWFFRDKYYKVDAVAQERNGIGIPVITLPDGYSDDDYEDAENMGKNLRGNEKAYVVLKKGWEFRFADQKAKSLKSPKEMLDHHTREILKSVLAQFADLGNKTTGSYALSKDQSQIFLESLEASAQIIEDVLNQEIQRLVDFNWNVEEYPKLTHAEIGIKDIEKFASAIQSFSFAGVLTPDSKTEDYIRDLLKLPEKEEVEEEEKTTPKEPPEEPEEEEEEFEGRFEGSERLARDLTAAEKAVRFNDIENFLDNQEDEIIASLVSIIEEEEKMLIPVLKSAIEDRDFDALGNIAFELTSKYRRLFRKHINDLFEYGKLRASYELGESAPSTPDEIKQRMSDRAIFLARYKQEKMMDEVKDIAMKAVVSDLPDDEAMNKVKKSFNKLKNINAKSTASLIAGEEFNNGRKFVFNNFKEKVYGFQWSAILDGATCNYCSSMDGKVVGVNDKALKEYSPGAVHFHCRCIWVAIMKDEVDPPAFTGIPRNRLKPQTVMPPWRFKDLDYPLPGAGERKK